MPRAPPAALHSTCFEETPAADAPSPAVVGATYRARRTMRPYDGQADVLVAIKQRLSHAAPFDSQARSGEALLGMLPSEIRAAIAGLQAENARLRAALEPFAEHSRPGWDTQSRRMYRVFVTEGQVARAWMALHGDEAGRD